MKVAASPQVYMGAMPEGQGDSRFPIGGFLVSAF